MAVEYAGYRETFDLAGADKPEALRMIHLDIPGKPIAQNRPRFFRRGSFVGTYNDQETEEGRWMLEVKSQLPKGFMPISGPVKIKAEFRFPYPSSFSKREQKQRAWHWNEKKPDLDNLEKFALDCLRNLVIGDDAAVCEMSSAKIYSRYGPKTIIEVKQA